MIAEITTRIDLTELQSKTWLRMIMRLVDKHNIHWRDGDRVLPIRENQKPDNFFNEWYEDIRMDWPLYLHLDENNGLSWCGGKMHSKTVGELHEALDRADVDTGFTWRYDLDNNRLIQELDGFLWDKVRNRSKGVFEAGKSYDLEHILTRLNQPTGMLGDEQEGQEDDQEGVSVGELLRGS